MRATEGVLNNGSLEGNSRALLEFCNWEELTLCQRLRTPNRDCIGKGPYEVRGFLMNNQAKDVEQQSLVVLNFIYKGKDIYFRPYILPFG